MVGPRCGRQGVMDQLYPGPHPPQPGGGLVPPTPLAAHSLVFSLDRGDSNPETTYTKQRLVSSKKKPRRRVDRPVGLVSDSAVVRRAERPFVNPCV